MHWAEEISGSRTSMDIPSALGSVCLEEKIKGRVLVPCGYLDGRTGRGVGREAWRMCRVGAVFGGRRGRACAGLGRDRTREELGDGQGRGRGGGVKRGASVCGLDLSGGRRGRVRGRARQVGVGGLGRSGFRWGGGWAGKVVQAVGGAVGPGLALRLAAAVGGWWRSRALGSVMLGPRRAWGRRDVCRRRHGGDYVIT